MQIKRANFEFLVLAAILGTIMATTLHFGYGPGVLVIVFWGIVTYFYLRYRKHSQQANTQSASPQDREDS